MTNQIEHHRKSILQVLHRVSRDEPVPVDNPLLYSVLVSQRVTELKIEDTPDSRQGMIEEILRDIINEIGLEQPQGSRAKRKQEQIFTILFHKMRRRSDKLGIPEASYDRYHKMAVDELTKRFCQREKRLAEGDDDDPQELVGARTRVTNLIQYLENNPKFDFFLLEDLVDSTEVIADNDYFQEAVPYFQRVLSSYNSVAQSSIVLNRKMRVIRQVGHGLMNLGDATQAATYFSQLNQIGEALEDWENAVHGIHMYGVTLKIENHWAAAVDQYAKALDLAIRKGPEPEHRQAWIQRDTISALIELGDFNEIPLMARKSFETRSMLGDVNGCMMTLQVLGKGYIAQGRYQEAKSVLHDALAISMELPSSYKLARTQLYIALAQLYWAWGKEGMFAEYNEKAKTLAIRYGFWHQFEELRNISNN
ncbi:MAG: tetratricopeptide repeat protein [Chloroflexota bacterium]